MRFLVKWILLTTLMCLIGCGHNRFNEYKTWGAAVSFPMGDLGSIGFGIGSIESTTAMVRGGSSFNSQTISGEGVFAGAGGTAKVTTFRANEQLNEGNVVKVMQSPDVPESVKVEIAKHINPVAPDFAPAAMQIREATLYSNGFTNELKHPFTSTGVDKVVEEVADTTEHVVHDAKEVITDTSGGVIDTAKNTVNTISDHLNPGKRISDTITNSTDSIRETVAKILMIVVIIFGSILILGVLSLLFRNKNKKPPKLASRNPIPPHFTDEDEEIQPDDTIDADIEDEPPQAENIGKIISQEEHPIRNAIMNFWYGVLEFFKSILFFWKDLDQETRDAAIDAGKRFFRKDKPEDKPKEEN